MNVLVYSGPGTTVESVKQCTDTLRRLLNPYYGVASVTPSVLRDEPWTHTTALLALPGGADLGFCRELNGNGNKKIEEYVRKGGSFLGFCAGGYYGASKVEFEVGDSSMEISGARELKFFPGICRGAVYSGFKYAGHQGCKAARLSVNKEAAGSDAEDFYCYFNGGGVFVDAAKFKSQGVEILASYLEPMKVDGGDSAAAVVYRKVGKGHTVLTGVHPEFFLDGNDSHNDKSLENIPSEVLETLEGCETLRLKFMRAILKKLGLKVNESDRPIPSLTRLKLTSSKPGRVETLLESLGQKVGFQGPANNLLVGTNETFRLHDARDELYTKQQEESSDDEHDLGADKKTKDVDVYYEGYPTHKETPYFDHGSYYESLDRFQKSNGIRGDLGSLMMYGEVVSSTSTMLDKNYNILAHLPHGLITVGTIQIAGRGRGNNIWVNPPGVLAVSSVLRFPLANSRLVVFVQYLVSLAYVEAIRGYGPQYADMPVFLKWPNDIYTTTPDYSPETCSDTKLKSHTKIGGVLVNSNILGDEYALVYGAGVNVSNAAPTTSVNLILEKYNAERASKGLAPLPPYRNEILLAMLQSKLETMLAIFENQGFTPFESRYYQLWLHSDQTVFLEQYDNTKAVIRGITLDFGLLNVEQVDRHGNPTGKFYQLQPDGNSFDIFKGLLKRKM